MSSESAGWRVQIARTLLRTLEAGRVHGVDDQTTRQALEATAETVQEIFEGREKAVEVAVAEGEVFVQGRPLRTSRSTYRSLVEHGASLEEIELNATRLRPGTDADDLESLLHEYAALLDAPSGERPSSVEPTESVELRRVEPESLLGVEREERPVRKQIRELYAAAVVATRRFLEGLRTETFEHLSHVKRITQQLVALAGRAPERLLAVSTDATSHDEPAGRAVNAAILALLMARRITDDPKVLRRTCFGALVAAVGHSRAAGLYADASPPNVLPELDRDARERLGPLNALLLLKHSRMRHPALRRATVAYEAGWLGYKEELGWPWGRKQRPAVESLVVEAARRFWEGLALEPSMDRRPLPAEVFAEMYEAADTKVEHATVRLCMEVMAFYEPGTAVETSTGWRGVVIEAGESIEEFARPVVRLIRTPQGEAADEKQVDLAADDAETDQYGVVRRALDSTQDDKLRAAVSEVREATAYGRPTPESVARPSRRNVHPVVGSGTGEKERWRDGPKRAPRPETTARSPRDDERPDEAPASSQAETEREDPDVVMEFGPGSTKPTTHTTKPLPEKLAAEADGETEQPGDTADPEPGPSAPDIDDIVRVEVDTASGADSEPETSGTLDEALEPVEPEEFGLDATEESDPAQEVLERLDPEEFETGGEPEREPAEDFDERLEPVEPGEFGIGDGDDSDPAWASDSPDIDVASDGTHDERDAERSRDVLRDFVEETEMIGEEDETSESEEAPSDEPDDE